MKWFLGVSLFLAGMFVGVQETGAQDRRIYNHHSEHNLIVYKAYYTPEGLVTTMGRFARLEPGRCTPPGTDWDYAAVEPTTPGTLPTWYSCGVMTFWNLHYEGFPVLYADLFWCYVPSPHPLGNRGMVSPVVFGWTPNDSDYVVENGVLPPSAYEPLPNAGYVE